MSEPSPPENFTWLIDDLLAGSGMPSTEDQMIYLRNQGVNVIITLTEQPLENKLLQNMTSLHIPIKDFTAPTIDQMKQFVSFVQDAKQAKQKVLVHCARGRGRTGTMLAAYLISSSNMDAESAIQHVRQKRPYSIETPEQEHSLVKFEESIQVIGTNST